MGFATFFALSLLSASHALSFGPGNVTNLKIVNKEISPDGFFRSAVLAGGTFPGTPILATKGQRLLINVEDELTDPTMLRSTSIVRIMHGIFQKDTPWADGYVSPFNRCPIAANNSFLYDFTPHGTFWYHSHLSTQYCDGLRGAVSETPSQSLHIANLFFPAVNQWDQFVLTRFTESTIISLGDWFHTPARGAQVPYFFTSNLINGKGRFVGGPASPLAVITVSSGLRYRFRLISMSCEPNFVFSIDGHEMTVIEADGVSTKPVVVDSIQIMAGQRYSFVLNANQKSDNYWIRSLPNFIETSFTGGVNSAILRYAGAKVYDPETKNTTSVKPLLETNLHPLIPVPVPGLPKVGGADVAINLQIGLDLSTIRYSLNGASFFPPTAPALLQILSGAQAAQDLLPSGSYYSLPPNKVIEISIPGDVNPGGPHPFHLHGHNFHVIRSAGSTEYNFVDPVVRDVVSTGFAGDNTTFRFVTDNPGPWFLHCHIDIHLEIGMAVVFAEDTEDIPKEVVPASWKKLCPLYDGLNANQL
ncbi:laccase [Mycena vulgaris]|nr:laccase [Mycena vulgaris]